MPDDSFYVRTDDGYCATVLTQGPWGSGLQHGGPPAALLAHEVETTTATAVPMMPVRVTIAFLRPVPIGKLTVETQLVRDGKRVQIVRAELQAKGRVVCKGEFVRMRTTKLDVPLPADRSVAPGPEQATAAVFPFFDAEVGYHTAIELRLAKGRFGEGHALGWIRMRHSLIRGEEPSALERLLVAADSGGGVSYSLDYRRYVFVNPDISVHLHRMPQGEWIGLDATTIITEPQGIGMADSVLHDVHGPVGRGLQGLCLDVLPPPAG